MPGRHAAFCVACSDFLCACTSIFAISSAEVTNHVLMIAVLVAVMLYLHGWLQLQGSLQSLHALQLAGVVSLFSMSHHSEVRPFDAQPFSCQEYH